MNLKNLIAAENNERIVIMDDNIFNIKMIRFSWSTLTYREALKYKDTDDGVEIKSWRLPTLSELRYVVDTLTVKEIKEKLKHVNPSFWSSDCCKDEYRVWGLYCTDGDDYYYTVEQMLKKHASRVIWVTTED